MVRETITIVNKSGKVVSTSKHLVNIFNEAKSAYNERKAELKAARKPQLSKKDDQRKLESRLETLTIEDDARSRRSSRRGSSDEDASRHRKRISDPSRRPRPPVARSVTDSFFTNDRSPREHRRSSHHTASSHADGPNEPRLGELVRRHTDGERLENRASHRSRRSSLDDIDMDLAYGELPPPLPVRKYDEEVELRAKMSGLQALLDECNCVQHSVTAIIETLQKNPDALAAVALTLAEISNIVSKMAPGALMTLKGSFPAVLALLASPEFAIAVGVGVGVTVVVLGGYKIIKKIQGGKKEVLTAAGGNARDSMALDSDADSLRELNHIERWRRGVVDVDDSSLGTSVDGEFITPGASKALVEEGKLTEADFKSDGKKRRKHRTKSEKSSRTSRSRPEVKAKTPASGIRMLFKSSS